MATNVHVTHNGVNSHCTPARMDGDFPAVHDAHMRRRQQKPPQRRYRPTFIRQWRQYRHLTLEKTVELMEQTTHPITRSHASLGRIERGLQPYSQELLESLAEVFRTDPASLLSRDPTDPDGIWSIWDQARPDQRALIAAYSQGLLAREAG